MLVPSGHFTFKQTLETSVGFAGSVMSTMITPSKSIFRPPSVLFLFSFS
eukprot:UN15413